MSRTKKKGKIEDLELLDDDDMAPAVKKVSVAGLMNYFHVFITVLLMVSFFALVVFIDLEIKDTDQFKFGDASLEIGNELPAWIEKEGLMSKIRLQTKDVKDSYFERSFFDNDVVGDLRSAFLKSPWLTDVTVERVYPNKLVVNPQFRKPVAAVLSKDGYWYVLDEECQVLPVVEKQGEERMNLIRFFNKDNNSLKFVLGEPIDNMQIKKCMGLMKMFLLESNVPKDLKSVEFFYHESEKTHKYVLRFSSGLEVHWGDFLFIDEIDRFPSKQLSSFQKIQLMQDQLSQQPNRLHVNVEFKNR